ncbi:MAG: DNA polymerase beta superfamily protein, partial [Phycisphaerales bacterium JB063]
GIWKKYLADDPTPKRKKYLYILRPLACIRYIELHNAQPPTLFDAVLEAIDWPGEAMDAVTRLVESKRAAEELGQMPADPVFSRFIPQWLDEAERVAEARPTNETETAELDTLIWDALLPHRS